MAEIVIDSGEIFLDKIRFPIKGVVVPQLISTLPGKIAIGDYELVDEMIASTWVINDQRGGILVEEMDESIHMDRCWWSTCNLGFKGHIVLPPLATDCGSGGLSDKDAYFLVDYNGVIYTALDTAFRKWDEDDDDFNDAATCTAGWVSPTGCTEGGTWADGENAYDESTTSKATVTWTGIGYSGTLELTLGLKPYCSQIQYYASRSTSHVTKIKIAVYYSDGWHEIYDDTPTISNWTTVALSGNYWVEKARVSFYIDEAVEHTAYLHEFDFGTQATTPALDSNPTDALVYSVSGTDKLFIADTDRYYVLSSTAWEQGDDDAVFFCEWDAKLCKVDATGQFAYSTNGTSWTDKGLLQLPDNSITSLFVYRDADAELQVYAGTKQGLYVHDYSNDKWIQTELTLPNHPTCGKGAIRWRDAAYVSAGLDVPKYIAARTASITFVGLNRDDGIPSEYRGEITKFIGGYNDFFALVDSSLVTGEGYSTVMAYDGAGWQCKWLSAVLDKTTKCGLVASTHDYRFWWGADNKIYSIPLQRDIRNPKKISTYTYAASGVHITPWFDAGWIGDKLALSIKLFCKGMSADEDVIVKYRIDHDNTDIDTGWTTMGTIEVDDVTEYTFGASAKGITFKAIQFRFDLASGTSTLSPDIQWVKLKYLKLLDTKWGWNVSIDCAEGHKGKTSAQLDAKIKSIVANQELVEFTFRNEPGGTYTYMVKVANCQGAERTAQDWRGEYNLALVAP